MTQVCSPRVTRLPREGVACRAARSVFERRAKWCAGPGVTGPVGLNVFLPFAPSARMMMLTLPFRMPEALLVLPPRQTLRKEFLGRTLLSFAWKVRALHAFGVDDNA